MVDKVVEAGAQHIRDLRSAVPWICTNDGPVPEPTSAGMDEEEIEASGPEGAAGM